MPVPARPILAPMIAAIGLTLAPAGCAEEAPAPPSPRATARAEAPRPAGPDLPSWSASGSRPHVPVERRSLLDGKLTIEMPKSFGKVGEGILRRKYPAEGRPTVVYGNLAASVNVALNHTEHPVAMGQLPEAHAAFGKVFRNQYPSASWFHDEVTTINGRRFLLFDLRTPALDTEVRNIIAGTVLEGRLLFVTFNVTKELEDEWLETGKHVIASVQVPE